MILKQGDCLNLMKEIKDKSIDMILCDLPYGTTACKWDTIIPFEPLWKEYNRIIKDNGTIVLNCSQPFTSELIHSNLKMFRYCWVWKSNRAANFAQAPYMPLKNTEDIAVFSKATIAQNSKNRMKYQPQGLIEIEKICPGKKANDHRPNRADQKPYKQTKTNYPTVVLEFDKPSSPVHPTQKPVELLEYLIKTYSMEGELILDNCMGSGSTGVSCVNTSRNFYGIEYDEKYFKIAESRIQEAICIKQGIPMIKPNLDTTSLNESA